MMRALRVGVLAGIVAGAVMAVWSMAAMWVTGSGFWLPLNLIAHTFYRSAPLDARFSAPALLIGLAVHMTVASIFGIAIAALVQRLRKVTKLPVAVGFGISAPDQFASVGKYADAAVIGSAIVQTIERSPGKEAQAVAEFIERVVGPRSSAVSP